MASLLALALPAYSGQSTDDWRHQRGSDYTGSIDAASPDAVSLSILWAQDVGDGFSGFVVASDRAVGQAQGWESQFVVCLDMESGRVLWRQKYERPWDVDGNYPGPYATPTIEGDRVFFTGCRGTVGCLELSTGDWVWRMRLDDLGVVCSGFGYACTPLVLQGRVFLPGGQGGPAVIALDAETGEVAWTAREEAAGYSSCLPIQVDGHSHVVTFLENAIVGHDPVTGRELWRSDWSHGYDPHPAWPVFDDPLLLCSAPFRRGSRCMRLSPSGDAWKAETEWESDVLCCDVLSGTVADGYVYGFDLMSIQADDGGETEGTFRCVEMATGRLCWATDQVGHASVVARGNHLLIWTDSGALIVAERTAEAFRELARRQIVEGALCWSPPAVSADRVLLRGGNQLVCVGLSAAREDVACVAQAKRETVLFGAAPDRGLTILAGAALLALMWGRAAFNRHASNAHFLAFVSVAIVCLVSAYSGRDGTFFWPVMIYALFATGSREGLFAGGRIILRLASLCVAVAVVFGMLWLGWVLRSEFMVATVVAMTPAPLVLRLISQFKRGDNRWVRGGLDLALYTGLCWSAFALASAV